MFKCCLEKISREESLVKFKEVRIIHGRVGSRVK